jgi:hypothetical protein
MTLLWLERLLSRPDALRLRQDAPQRAADTSARDEVSKRPATARENRSALDQASAFLVETLADGPRPSKEVQAEAKARGIAWATLRRAMPKAGVKKQKVRFQGRWVLSLQTCSGAPKDAQDSSASTFAKVARERPAEEAKRSDQDLSEATDTPACPDPNDVLVPPGFIIPPGGGVGWVGPRVDPTETGPRRHCAQRRRSSEGTLGNPGGQAAWRRRLAL